MKIGILNLETFSKNSEQTTDNLFSLNTFQKYLRKKTKDHYGLWFLKDGT